MTATPGRLPRNMPSGREPVRPLPADFVRPLRVRWPSDRQLVPPACGHCRAGTLVIDTPTAAYPVADVLCYLCSRVICELVLDPTFAIAPLSKAWSPGYDRCRDCGRSDRPHSSHGRCSPCAMRARRTEARNARRCVRCGLVPPAYRRTFCDGCRRDQQKARTA